MKLIQTRHRNGLFTIVAAMLISAVIITLAFSSAQLGVFQQNFRYEPAKETVTEITSDLDRALTHALSIASKNYSDSGQSDIDKSRSVGEEYISQWQRSEVSSHSNLGLQIPIKPAHSEGETDVWFDFQWNLNPGRSVAQTVFGLDVVNYGLRGWKGSDRVARTLEIIDSSFRSDLTADTTTFKFKLTDGNGDPITGLLAEDIMVNLKPLGQEMQPATVNSLQYVAAGVYQVELSHYFRLQGLQKQMSAVTPGDQIYVSAYQGISSYAKVTLDTKRIKGQGSAITINFGGTLYNDFPKDVDVIPPAVQRVEYIPGDSSHYFYYWQLEGYAELISGSLTDTVIYVRITGDAKITAWYSSDPPATTTTTSNATTTTTTTTLTTTLTTTGTTTATVTSTNTTTTTGSTLSTITGTTTVTTLTTSTSEITVTTTINDTVTTTTNTTSTVYETTTVSTNTTETLVTTIGTVTSTSTSTTILTTTGETSKTTLTITTTIVTTTTTSTTAIPTVLFYSVNSTGTSENDGNVTVLGESHPLPYSVSLPVGTYNISFTVPANNFFVSWDVNDWTKVLLDNTMVSSTTLHVLQDGGVVTAIYSPIPNTPDGAGGGGAGGGPYDELYVSPNGGGLSFSMPSADGFIPSDTSHGSNKAIVDLYYQSVPADLLIRFDGPAYYWLSVSQPANAKNMVVFIEYKPPGSSTYILIGQSNPVPVSRNGANKPVLYTLFPSNNENNPINPNWWGPGGEIYVRVEVTYDKTPYGVVHLYYGPSTPSYINISIKNIS